MINNKSPYVLIKLLIVAQILFCLSCTKKSDDDSLNFGKAINIGIVNKPDSVDHLQGGISLKFSDKVLWLFSETQLKQQNSSGTSNLSNTAAWVVDEQLTQSTEFNFITNDNQELIQFIPYTAAEEQYNTDNAGSIKLYPLGGFVYEDTGYIYYHKLEFPGLLQQISLGVGIAQVDSDGSVSRLSPEIFTDPHLFWDNNQYGWGEGAFIASDGYAYLFSTIDKGGLKGATRAARVDLASLTDINGYEYWGGFDWQSNQQQAAEIYSSGKSASIDFNAYHEKYLTVYNNILSNTVVLRTAEKINEDWNVEVPLFTGVEPVVFSITDVRQHKAYETGNGKKILVSYASKIKENQTDVYLVQYDFF